MSKEVIQLTTHFDGESTDVREWFEKFELICKLQRFNNKKEILPAVISGKAFVCLKDVLREEGTSYEDAKKCLIDTFSESPDECFNKLINTNYHIGENIDVHVNNMKHWALGSGDWLIKIITRSLPQEIRQEVIRQNPETLEELKKIVKYSLLNIKNVPVMSIKTVPGKCFICDNEGHQAKLCPDKSRIQCKKCKKIGHQSKYCRSKNMSGTEAIQESLSVPKML